MALRAMYRYALDGEHITCANPCDGLTWDGPVRVARKQFSLEHLQALLDALPAGRWRTFYGLAVFAGLRAGEIQGLTWRDVDFASRKILVRRSWDPQSRVMGAPKSGAGVRDVPMVGPIRDLLMDYRLATEFSGRDRIQTEFNSGELRHAAWAEGIRGVQETEFTELTFPGERGVPSNTSAFYAAANPAWDALGLERVPLHEARHAFVTIAIAAGWTAKEVQVAAGHSHIATTFDIYGKFLDDSTEKNIAQFDERWGTTGAGTGASESRTPIP